MEEAEQIAINDAKRTAINSMGVFLESKLVVSNNMLTSNEIKTITGAIIKTIVLNKEKKLENDIFIIRIEAQFDIDETSLDNALSNYQNKSQSKKTIKKLTEIIQDLQSKLLKKDSKSYDIVEIVDEIAFTNKRLNKLLSTKDQINNEVEILNVYKEKLKQTFINKTYPALLKYLKPKIFFSEMPANSYSTLKLNYLGEEIDYSFHINIIEELDDISKNYDELNFKVKPNINYNIRFTIPVIAYINAEKTMDYFITINIRGCRNDHNDNRSSYSSVYFDRNKKYVLGSYQKESQSLKFLSDYEKKSIYIDISNYTTLDNIEDISVRLGTPKEVIFEVCEEKLFQKN